MIARALLALGLVLVVVPSALAASPQEGVRRIAQLYQEAEFAKDYQRSCALLTPKARKESALLYRILVDTPKVDCALGAQAVLAEAPWIMGQGQAADAARLQALSRQALAGGKVTIARNRKKARIAVRYPETSCDKKKGSWQLQRVAGRWRVVAESAADLGCYARPASDSEAAVLREVFVAQINAAARGDAQAFCQATDFTLMRMLVGVFLLFGGEQAIAQFHFDCVEVMGQGFKEEPLPTAQETEAALAAAAGYRWTINNGVAVGSLPDNKGCALATLTQERWRAAFRSASTADSTVSCDTTVSTRARLALGQRPAVAAAAKAGLEVLPPARRGWR